MLYIPFSWNRLWHGESWCSVICGDLLLKWACSVSCKRRWHRYKKWHWASSHTLVWKRPRHYSLTLLPWMFTEAVQPQTHKSAIGHECEWGIISQSFTIVKYAKVSFIWIEWALRVCKHYYCQHYEHLTCLLQRTKFLLENHWILIQYMYSNITQFVYVTEYTNRQHLN